MGPSTLAFKNKNWLWNLTGILIVGCLVVLISSHSASAAELGKGPDNPRMSSSASPYLHSHSHDLVRWYAWGEEAFARARKTQLPIMVSFGYTACHWCHVMQKEHFNDAAIAKHINEKFVPILVDRERRSSLDETYLLVTELLTQRSGWPNTVFLTPELKPIYGTAYIPPESFAELLTAVTGEWTNNRETTIAEGERIVTVLNGFLNRQEEARSLTSEVLAETAKSIAATFDQFAGGIGDAPKFFRPTVLMFLLQQYQRNGDPVVLNAVEVTLQSIMSGGIHDHIEGGFHRYAIDPGWRVPHFEKMLYDQAQLAEIFTQGYIITGKPEYAAAARKTLDYILNDLTAPSGGFYSTRDADSEGEEGTYYVWTPEQLETVLGKTDADYAIQTFGMIGDGDFAGKIILNRDDTRGQSVPRLTSLMAKLGEARKSREKPVRDEKILASWNGLTIASFASAGQLLSEPRYTAAAEKAANFIWNNMRKADGGLQRSYFATSVSVDAELDDYAHLARGYLYLFDATAAQIWRDRALKLASGMADLFSDKEHGDFYATAANEGFGRIKPRSDVDQPSGNGAALDVIAMLSKRLLDPAHKRDAERTMAALSGLALGAPPSSASILLAGDKFMRGETGSIQYAGNGVLRAIARAEPEKRRVHVELQIADGWHINADRPLEEHLIPTKLELLSEGKVADTIIGYPAPDIKNLKFNEKPMALLENKVTLSAHLDDVPASGLKVSLDVQVCSDDLCLLPETLELPVIPAPIQQN